MITIEAYETFDGKVFKSREEALAHEKVCRMHKIADCMASKLEYCDGDNESIAVALISNVEILCKLVDEYRSKEGV